MSTAAARALRLQQLHRAAMDAALCDNCGDPRDTVRTALCTVCAEYLGEEEEEDPAP